MTEAPPTTDQLKNILDYLGGTNAASKVIAGASDESDAMRRLKADGDAFQRPLVSPFHMAGRTFANLSRWWIGTKEKQVSSQSYFWKTCCILTDVVIGENESEILSLLRSKSAEKA